MHGVDDEQVSLRHARAVISRYAHQTGWERGEERLDERGWAATFQAEFTTEEGVDYDRLLVWRPLGAQHTSLRFRTELDPGQMSARREHLLALVADHDLAAIVREEGGRSLLETSTRLYDEGLNFETFQHATECLFACRDAVRAALER